MEIVNETQKILSEHYEEWSRKWDSYADAIISNEEKITEAIKTFHEWAPLRVYMPINQTMRKKTVLFSVRCMGKDVAQIKVDVGKKPILAINSNNHLKANRKRLGIEIQDGNYDWVESVEAKAFRKKFADPKNYLINDEEHKLESLILDEMELKSTAKFMEQLHFIQPIELYDKMRFQMKVPLSANKGYPQYSNSGGGIDILARIGRSQDTNLGIIELKKEGAESYRFAMAQSIIYSVCIINILRDPLMGGKWWKIFGYERQVPNSLKIHSIAMVPNSSKQYFLKEFNNLGLNENPVIKIGTDFIHCASIFFNKKTDDGRERIFIDHHQLS